MAANKAHGHADMQCPDPSVHEKQNQLSAAASTAALYVTNPQNKNERAATPKEDVLDSDGKLSSKGAAASLKYAKPHELPSFPSVGISSSAAGAAAVLAKDYKGREIVRPEGSSAAGSKAALLAHKKGADLNLWQPTASKDGNSAATLAMGNKNLSPQLDRGYTAQGKSNALLAATKSQKDTRQRGAAPPAVQPDLYPDQSNSARNALSAATAVAGRNLIRSPQPPAKSPEPQYSDPAMQAARIQNIGKNVAPEMWGDRPPVEIELEEQRQKAALRASAVSMAKQMYDYQNRAVRGSDPSGQAGATAAQKRAPASQAPADLKTEALRYIHLQDAAKKLAQERLDKMDKDMEHTKYREHYGYDAEPHRNRLSMRGRPRQRAASEQAQDDDDSSDDERARRVRRQMAQLNNATADVDAKKKDADRKALLAAAERNVHKSMDTMDEQVFQSTGKISQAKMDEWAAKAREKAQKDAELRGQNHGKTHIGGGRFMDQAAIEAIAQSRLQPTLDQINDTAEKKRAKDEEMRLDKEEQERQKRTEKQKHKEEKDEQKHIKQEEKAVAKKEKDERKAAEKAEKENRRKSAEIDDKPEKKSLLSRLASKRKSRNVSKDEADGSVAGTTAGTAAAITPVATTEDVVDMRKSTEVPDASRNSADVEVLGAPISAAGSKDSSVLKNKPNLERYITNLDTSSESSDDDEDTRVRKRDKRQRSGLLSRSKTDNDEPVATTEETESPVVAAVSPVRSRSIDLPAENASTRATKSMDLDGATTTTSDLPLTDEAEIIANRAVAAPVDAPRHLATVISDDDVEPRQSTTADSIAAPRESTASSHPDLEQEKAQDGKTIRGFFSKLRNRASSKPSAGEPGNFGGKKADKDVVVPTSSSARPASASSFDRYRASAEDSPTRGRKKSADLSSISSDSSGLDEDDFVGGRTGRMARAEKGTGLGAPIATTTKTRKGVRSDDDDSDQFEEARDHFDEGLAPKPNFAGQAKSASPARETKFHEEV